MFMPTQRSICLLSFITVLCAMLPPTAANQRQFPKIGLALSGGGARAASHIGVLKVLEHERIPIDCIAGTSFGALVGGLYSMGYSATEIEHFFMRQDWNNIFSDAPQRRLTPLIRRKDARYQGQISFQGWNLELPTGLWEGQRLTEALAVLAMGPMLQAQYDFDRLPIRFRAVATNLIDGKVFVFRKGPMTDALRASMAVPLLFTPLEKDDMLLVDGGLTDNLPSDIVRDMGADIIIAVDATSPLLEKDEIRTFFDVVDQSISLQMEQTVQKNRELAHILMQPDLEEFTNSDYGNAYEIVARGEDEAKRHLQQIKILVAGIPFRHPAAQSAGDLQIIDSLSFRGLKHIKPAQLKRNLHNRPGEPVDAPALSAAVGRLYATGLFERVEYTLEPLGNNRYHLVYIVKEAPLNNLGGSLRYDTAYDFVALAEFTARQLFDTPSMLTISSQFGGLEDHSAALHFVPSFAPFMFIVPKVDVLRQERLDIRDRVLLDTFTDKREGGQLVIGASFFRQIEFDIGYRYERVRVEGGSQPNRLEGTLKEAGFTFRLNRDSLDAAEFPSNGSNIQIQVDTRNPAFGGDLNYSKWQADYDRYISISGKSTFQFHASGAYSRGAMQFYDLFFIGGLPSSERASRQFLGLNHDELSVRQMALISADYRRLIFSHPLSFIKRGFLNGTYNGLYFSTRQDSPYQFDLLNGGGIGLALDTMIGPIRAMGGWSEGGRFNFYISLGPRF